MPIIEPARPGAPLTQGDLLSGVTLYATKESWEEKGGQASVVKSELCLVLSRPCVASHKKHVIVASVAKFPDSVPKNIDSFDKVLDFLTGARNGDSSPDVFYLGQLPGRIGRFCARLDSFHTIEIPEGDEQRTQFLAARRTLTLHPDFARDLHMRILRRIREPWLRRPQLAVDRGSPMAGDPGADRYRGRDSGDASA